MDFETGESGLRGSAEKGSVSLTRRESTTLRDVREVTWRKRGQRYRSVSTLRNEHRGRIERITVLRTREEPILCKKIWGI